MARSVQEQVRRLTALMKELRAENARLTDEVAGLQNQNARLQQRVEELEAERQAVQFRDRLRRQRDHLLGCLQNPAPSRRTTGRHRICAQR